jgi:hypothetical protein
MRRRVASRRLASVSRPPAPAAARRCRGSRRRSRPAGGHELIEASGRVAEGAARALDDVPVLLLRVAAEERHSLEGPELRPDADRLQRVDHRLREVRVRHVAVVLARVEAVGVAGLGQELGRAGAVVDRRGRRPEVLERGRDDAAGETRVAEGERLVDRRAIDGEARGEAYTPVVPGQLRVPLLGDVEPERRLDDRGLEGEPRRLLQLLGQLSADRVGDVDLAALERGHRVASSGMTRSTSRFHARRLPPVLVEGLLKPSSPTFSTYLRGTIQPAPVALV